MSDDDTITPIESGYVDLATLVRVLSDDVETVSNTDELQERAPTEGRVAEVAAGNEPYDVYIATGGAWLNAAAELGLTVPTQQVVEQDLTAGDAPAPTSNGIQAVHDGTGTPPAGSYVSDPANNQWVGADDLTSGTTISY
jgi:hypothetical protein